MLGTEIRPKIGYSTHLEKGSESESESVEICSAYYVAIGFGV